MHRRSQRGPTPPKLLLLVLDWLDVDVGEPPAEGDNAMASAGEGARREALSQV